MWFKHTTGLAQQQIRCSTSWRERSVLPPFHASMVDRKTTLGKHGSDNKRVIGANRSCLLPCMQIR